MSDTCPQSTLNSGTCTISASFLAEYQLAQHENYLFSLSKTSFLDKGIQKVQKNYLILKTEGLCTMHG